MTTFEELFCKAKSAAETVGKKTGEVVEITKLKMEAAQAEQDLSHAFEELGRLMFRPDDNNAEVDEAIAACRENITVKQENLSRLRASIDAYKKGIRCETCGTVNAEDSVFCKKCGKSL